MRMITAKVAGFFGLAFLLLTTAAAQEPTKSAMAYLPQGESLRAYASWRVTGREERGVLRQESGPQAFAGG